MTTGPDTRATTPIGCSLWHGEGNAEDPLRDGLDAFDLELPGRGGHEDDEGGEGGSSAERWASVSGLRTDWLATTRLNRPSFITLWNSWPAVSGVTSMTSFMPINRKPMASSRSPSTTVRPTSGGAPGMAAPAGTPPI